MVSVHAYVLHLKWITFTALWVGALWVGAASAARSTSELYAGRVSFHPQCGYKELPATIEVDAPGYRGIYYTCQRSDD